MTHNISVTMRDRVGVNGPPIGNHLLRVLWSRDWWRNVW